MAQLLFVDSFDHYSDTQGTRKWNGWGGGIEPAGRTGKCLGSGGHTLVKTFNSAYMTLTAGAAFKFGAPFSASSFPWRFYQADAPIARTVNFEINHNGDGRLYLSWYLVGYPTPGVTSSVLSGLTTFVLSLDRWYYIEVQASMTAIGPPAHLEARLRINGVEVLSWSTDLNQTAIPFNTVMTKMVGRTDDVYVTDTEFLGDVRVGVLYPNAAGDSAAWVPTGAPTNWQATKETPADDNTTYVATPAIGAKDLYHLDNIDPAFSGIIKGVQANWCVKKSDEGEGATKGVWKSTGVEIVQADGYNYQTPNGFYPSATEYLYNMQTKRVSLFTGSDWTKAEVDGLQLGIQRTL